MRIPSLFNNQETFLNYAAISSVTIDTPLIGFSTISFSAYGKPIRVHGFTRSEVREIKRVIENGSGEDSGVETFWKKYKFKKSSIVNVIKWLP